MENSTLTTLLSVFDFRSGPKPVFCFPQDMGIDKTTQIAFKGHLILSKVSQSTQSKFESLGSCFKSKLITLILKNSLIVH